MKAITNPALRLWLILLAAYVVIIQPLWGIDRWTTISWRTPATVGIACIMGVALGAFHLKTLDAERRQSLSKVKQLVGAGMIASSCVVLLGSLLGVLAQHIPGERVQQRGIVEKVRHFSSARAACRSDVTVRESGTNQAEKICVLSSGGNSIGPNSLVAGDNVIVNIRATPLGTVAESIERGGSEPHEP